MYETKVFKWKGYGLEIRMFENYKIVGHILGVVIRYSGCHCIGATCARIEVGNDWIEEQALGLCSAVQFAVELGLQDLVVEYEIKGFVDEPCAKGPINLRMATSHVVMALLVQTDQHRG